MEQLLSLYRASGSNISPSIFIDLVNRSLAVPGVYTLGEFYDILESRVESSPSLKNEASVGSYLSVLEIFVYGNWNDYIKRADELPSLSDLQIKKLKQLTLASLGATAKVLKYSTIGEHLSLGDSEIERFLIDSIYDEVCVGLIDSKHCRFEIQSVIARDVSPQRVEEIERILEERIRNINNIINENKTISFLSREQAGQRKKHVDDYRAKLNESLQL